MKVSIVRNHPLGSLVLLLALSACSSVPSGSPVLESRDLAALSIDSSKVALSEGTYLGVTSQSSQVADFRPAYVILTDSDLHLITWNAGASIGFKKELSVPIRRIDAASLVPYGNMGHLRQVHIFTDVGKVVLSFSLGESARGEQIFSTLTRAGVRVTPPGKSVQPPQAGNFVPIFIPMR